MSQQDVPTTEGRGQLREYLAVLWLRKWSIALVTGLVVAGTLAFSLRQTPQYESESRVLVKTVSLSGQVTGAAQPNMETETQLVASSQVATRVIDDVGLEADPREIASDLTVEVLTGTEILLITYEGPDPAETQQIAQAFASSYLQYRRQEVLEDLKAAADGIQEQIEDVEKQINKAEVKAEDLPVESAERGGVEAQISSLSSQKASLLAEYNDLVDPEDLQVGSILEPAVRPLQPVSPDPIRNGILAGMAGLLLGVGLAFLRERLDDRLRGRPDLESHIEAPVLAVIPKVPSWKRKAETPVVTISEPRSASSEAYRTLRTSLLFAASQLGAKTLLITSPHAGEGKTATSGNLALVLAQARKRVVLLSADLRKPRLHRFFGVPNDVGLTSVLIGEAKPWEAVIDVGHEYLRLVPSGPVPGNPAELLGSDAMGRLLAQFREVSDFVILDSAPALVVADALTLAPFADAALFVADAEHTTRSAVIHARSQLDQVNAQVIGAVLNNFDPSKAKSSPYYYSYYYTYKYEESPQRSGGLLRRRVGKEEGPYPVGGSRRVTGFERGEGPSDEGDDSGAVQRARMEGLWGPAVAPEGNGEERAPEADGGRQEPRVRRRR